MVVIVILLALQLLKAAVGYAPKLLVWVELILEMVEGMGGMAQTVEAEPADILVKVEILFKMEQGVVAVGEVDMTTLELILEMLAVEVWGFLGKVLMGLQG